MGTDAPLGRPGLALSLDECQSYLLPPVRSTGVDPRGPTVGTVEAREWQTLGAVAAGGALGGLARWGVALALPWDPPSLPVATLTVNLVGCVAIGVLLTLWTEGPTPPWWARPFAAVGFVAGFTTFSAFAVEAVQMVDAGATGGALGYVAVSIVAGVLLVRLSSVLTRRVVGPARGDLR